MSQATIDKNISELNKEIDRILNKRISIRTFGNFLNRMKGIRRGGKTT